MNRSGSALKLGEWSFLETDGSLTRGLVSKRLDPRLAKLLEVLIERRGEIVDKQTMLDSVWADTAVAEDAVTVAIYELRKALEDDARAPRYLETVPKRGYRLIAHVDPMDTDPDVSARARARWPIAAIALALAISIGWSWWPDTPVSEPVVVAVVPFANHSSESEDYIASAVSDSLTTDLTRVPGVSVLAHRSMRRLDPNDDRALGALGVTHLVTGSIVRHEGRLRVNVALSRRSATTIDWSETYVGSLSELLPLQRQVAVSIASALDHELDPEPRSQRRDAPERATEAYLLGRYFWNQRDATSIRKSVRLFREALEADPAFARAWAGLADAYTFPGPSALELSRDEGYRLALDAARRAQELDPTLAEAYVSAGAVGFVYEWDLEAAESDFRRALALAPSSALAHQWFAELLSATGRHDEAVAHMREAHRLDPRSAAILFDLFWVQYMALDFHDAIDTLDEVIALASENDELDPTLFWSKARLQARLDRMEEALDSLSLFFESVGQEPTAEARALMTDPSVASFRRFRIDTLRKLADLDDGYSLALAGAYADAGMTAAALEWLEKAAHERDGAILWIAVSPDLQNLRDEPRFIDLKNRIGVGGV